MHNGKWIVTPFREIFRSSMKSRTMMVLVLVGLAGTTFSTSVGQTGDQESKARSLSSAGKKQWHTKVNTLFEPGDADCANISALLTVSSDGIRLITGETIIDSIFVPPDRNALERKIVIKSDKCRYELIIVRSILTDGRWIPSKLKETNIVR